MEGTLTYTEIYLEADGKKKLHSRVIDDQTLAEVLEEIQGKHFEIRLIWNRCVVGNGMYDYSNGGIVAAHEDGTCIGFLGRSFRV